MTPGMTTSEFWLSLAALVAAVIFGVTEVVDGNSALTAVTGISAGYAVSRGLAKRTHGG